MTITFKNLFLVVLLFVFIAVFIFNFSNLVTWFFTCIDDKIDDYSIPIIAIVTLGFGLYEFKKNCFYNHLDSIRENILYMLDNMIHLKDKNSLEKEFTFVKKNRTDYLENFKNWIRDYNEFTPLDTTCNNIAHEFINYIEWEGDNFYYLVKHYVLAINNSWYQDKKKNLDHLILLLYDEELIYLLLQAYRRDELKIFNKLKAFSRLKKLNYDFLKGFLDHIN